MTDYALGCDISHWQDKPDTPEKVDFDRMKLAGADFVFMKASQKNWTDRDFTHNWAAAKAAGLLRGAYHFLTFDISARKQAEHFWSLLEGDPGELPPVCDYERYGNVPKKASDYLWAFVTTLERLSGRVPIIYSGAFFWSETSTQAAAWTKYPLWIASYTGQSYMQRNVDKRMPWDTWTFWQYTDRGDGEKYGVESKQIDLNYYNGTTEELADKYGGVDEAPPVLPMLTIGEKVTRLWDAHPELHA